MRIGNVNPLLRIINWPGHPIDDSTVNGDIVDLSEVEYSFRKIFECNIV